MNNRKIGLHFTTPAPTASDDIRSTLPGAVTLFRTDTIRALVPVVLSIVPDCQIALRPFWTEQDDEKWQGYGSTVEEAILIGERDADTVCSLVRPTVLAYPDGDYLAQCKNEPAQTDFKIMVAYYISYMNRVDWWKLYIESELGGKSIHFRALILDRSVGGIGKDWVQPFIAVWAKARLLDCRIGYHGYGAGGENSRTNCQLMMCEEKEWFALRMVELYREADSLGIQLPNTVHTEAGTFDPWHGKFSDTVMAQDTVAFADFIADYFPQIEHFTLFDWGRDPKWEGFRYQSSLISQSIKANNLKHNEGGLPLPEGEVTPEQLKAIQDSQFVAAGGQGLNEDSAFGQYWLAHPEIGMPFGPVDYGLISGMIIQYFGNAKDHMIWTLNAPPYTVHEGYPPLL